MWIDLNKVDAYVQLLLKWNGVYRLVGPTAVEDIYDLHVTDALVLAPLVKGEGSVVDLGSGAGLPGIVLKIVRPELDLILVEPQRKRLNFCEEVIRRLGLSRIRVVCGRADDGPVRKEVGAVGTVVSRAVWGLETYVSIARTYIGINGGDIVHFAARDAQLPQSVGREAIIGEQRIPYSTLLHRRERLLLILRMAGQKCFT